MGLTCADAGRKRSLWSHTTEDNVSKVVFDKPLALPAGPSSQWERLAWPDDLWQRLDGDMRDRLVRNLSRLRHKDHFSGSASSAQIWTQIVETVKRFTDITLPDVVTTNSTELQHYRRKHINLLERGRPRHCSANIFDRLPKDVRAEMMEKAPDKIATTPARKLANREAAEYIFEQYQSRGADMSRGPCDWHPGSCCDMFGVEDVADGAEVSKAHLTCCTGGIPCVDSSTMNLHASGDGGRTFLCSSVFLAERAACQEDFICLERTWRWNCGLLQERLPSK